jgi:cobalt-zinc-cadmium efflux system outer membrane protein
MDSRHSAMAAAIISGRIPRGDMRNRFYWCCAVLLLSAATNAGAQEPWTWDQVRQRFQQNNPTLLAGQLTVGEAQANETTANLRPNPSVNMVLDQFPVFDQQNLNVNNAQWTLTATQLIERRNKRHLRYQSAQLSTRATEAGQKDLERSLLFSLRDAFIRLLQAKSILQLAEDNLAYYDKVVDVNRQRYQAGDIAKIDFTRVELQRAQFASDFQNAQVSLRQAKIDLLALMNDRTPVDQFDVTGLFDFRDTVPGSDELRQEAISGRPDVAAAATSVERAKVDNRLAWANGSTDPDLGLEYQRTGPENTLGLNLTIPLRIFDRNQGEKERTRLEIDRSQHLLDATQTGVLRDVDSARASLVSVLSLLKPYRDQYIPQSTEVRETISFSYSHGGASLLDFLDAQREYRDTQLNYRNLIASYLAAVNQLNFTVGREVIP